MKSHQEYLLKKISKLSRNEGRNSTSMANVSCLKISSKEELTKRIWHSCLAIVIQGTKEVHLDNSVFKAKEFYYSASPVDLPVISRISHASQEKPFFALLIDFDLRMLSELAAELDKASPLQNESSSAVIIIGVAKEEMIENVIKLMKLLESPEDARVIGPLIIKEIFYYLLKTSKGSAIRRFVRLGSNVQKISSVIHEINTDLSKNINVIKLAKSSNMSRSLFFQAFKEVTTMSPIQYQKRLRLIEARRLMVDEKETAENAAYRVGYNSASQFNREYSRMFGTPPIKDVTKIRSSNKNIVSD